ncbi:MAG: nicotinate-nucleotide--dimethylbenzimidazole phosphoribosyltransferase [Rhodocyclaceae bacterium]
MKDYDVPPLDNALRAALQARIDCRTKPPGSLGMLEDLALRLGLIQRSVTPCIQNPRVVVFAGDHGAAASGVSAYPAAVTGQMVSNFLTGGAAINALARANGLALSIVDAGVASDYSTQAVEGIEYVDASLGPGTCNYLFEPAMSLAHVNNAIGRGIELAMSWADGGCDAIGFGEMGIGNTASASLVTKLMCGVPLDDVVGRGTGLDDAGLARKRDLLRQAQERVGSRLLTPHEVLAEFGGFEIAMMTGAYIGAARAGIAIVVDGFIATSALLVAVALAPNVREYCFFAHRSAETGHAIQLAYLEAHPMLQLGMRLGEGSGAALGLSLLRSAAATASEMAGFDDAGVSRG